MNDAKGYMWFFGGDEFGFSGNEFIVGRLQRMVAAGKTVKIVIESVEEHTGTLPEDLR